MIAAKEDSVLIEQVVLLASKARQATGQDPIFDIPKGTSSGRSCPIARALNLACSVGGASITFTNPEHARLIGEALNLSYSGNIVHIRTGHPFQSFVSRFDRGESKQMRRLKITTAASTL